MTQELTRRDALVLGIAAGSATIAARMSAAAGSPSREFALQVPPEARELTAYANGGQILLRWNNSVVAAYRANPVQKYPYFSDLAGPVSGLPLTSESSLPFPHHRGLWLGCEPLNGGDYWRDSELALGQIRSCCLELGKTTPLTAEVVDRCEWVREGEPTALEDQRLMRFSVVSETLRTIDFDFILTAGIDLTISKAKHSFFALRAAPDIAPCSGGTLANSAGQIGEPATHGKSAHWCGFHGARAGRPDVVEGIALMDHPDNPWAPCPWFTRDYGHLSPSPFGFLDRPWRLDRGQSIRLRYRVVLHGGTPDDADLDGVYDRWIST